MKTPPSKRRSASAAKTKRKPAAVKSVRQHFYPTMDDDNPMAFVLHEADSPVYALSPFQKINKIKAGISKKELSAIKNAADLDYDTLAELLSVARATLINKKNDEKFSTNISEKIFALADLYSFGYAVFGEVDKFNRWMKSPNMSIANQSPLALADTLTGIGEIKNMIGRISYGVYS